MPSWLRSRYSVAMVKSRRGYTQPELFGPKCLKDERRQFTEPWSTEHRCPLTSSTALSLFWHLCHVYSLRGLTLSTGVREAISSRCFALIRQPKRQFYSTRACAQGLLHTSRTRDSKNLHERRQRHSVLRSARLYLVLVARKGVGPSWIELTTFLAILIR